jgi:hypothetical protein
MTNNCKTAAPGKSIYPVAIVAAVFAVCCSLLPVWGFALLSLPFVFFWMLFQIARAVSQAETRKFRLLRVGVWFLAFALLFAVNAVRDRLMRQEADAIVTKIQDYHAQQGTCPPTLESIGESRKSFWKKLGGVYGCEEGKPHLSYRVPYNGFDRYHYDFERKAWDYVLD